MYSIDNFVEVIAPAAGVKIEGVRQEDFEILFEYDRKYSGELPIAIYESCGFPIAYYNQDEYLGYYIA
jgi:hypothetical protein